MIRKRTLLALLAIAVPVLAGAGLALAGDGSARGGGGPLQIVAAENVWGSIAAQLGGARVHVTSVIANPAVDPHVYEPTAADARAIADARLVILDGVGYDPWAAQLIAASPLRGRIVLTVGDLVGVKPGGNPHRWYAPADVRRVIAAIAGAYASLDPGGAAYFRRRRASFETRGLARYERLIATIRRQYHGVPVGASESVFAPLAQALGLRLLTPPSFLEAISEGTEPTAADTATVQDQIARRRIAVWVYNSQNATPDVARATAAARRRGIPVTTITETLAPASATFQAWQSRQLEALAAALKQATGR